MGKKSSGTLTKEQADHKVDQGNPNKGTSGTNKAYDHVQGNRGKQMNPNNDGKNK